MKNKHIIILFIAGAIITFFGALFKIAHWKIGILTGMFLITTGISIKVIAAVLFIIKLILNRKNEFLNQ